MLTVSSSPFIGSLEIRFPDCVWLMTGRWASKTAHKFYLFMSLPSSLVYEPHERPLKIHWSRCGHLCCSLCWGLTCQGIHRTHQYPGEKQRVSMSGQTPQEKSDLKETDSRLLFLQCCFPFLHTHTHARSFTARKLPTYHGLGEFCDFMTEAHFYFR